VKRKVKVREEPLLSEPRIILKLKIGETELQLEGSRQTVMEMVNQDIPKIIENISKISLSRTIPEKALNTSQVGEEQYPSITAKSCSEAILALLSTPWGRKPKGLSQIKSALETNALHYSSKVIGFTLTRLTKKQKLRRWKTEAGFVYTITT